MKKSDDSLMWAFILGVVFWWFISQGDKEPNASEATNPPSQVQHK